MQAIKKNGLAGKARRVRRRNRAARLHACQMVHEYFEPDTEDLFRERYIPIRSRAEFVPSVLQDNDNETTLSQSINPGSQLQLPLTAEPHQPSPQKAPLSSRKDSMDQSHDKREAVVRFPATGGKAQPKRRSRLPYPSAPAKERLTLQGFLLGCAMGSAAAAVLLLMVRTAVG